MQVTEFLNAGARQFGFMVRGLQLMQPKLEALNIPFFLLKGVCLMLPATISCICFCSIHFQVWGVVRNSRMQR